MPEPKAKAPAKGKARSPEPKPVAEPLPPLAPTLRILETRVLRGPNVWVTTPGHPDVVDLGVLEQYPSNTIPGFNEALMALLPTMEEHACSLGRRGGFFSRLADGTWLGHVAEHIALELQSLAGTEVRIGKTRSTGQYRPLRRHLRVPRGAGRPGGRPHRGRARQLPRRAGRPRRVPGLRRPPWSGSSGSRSGRPSGRRRRPSSTRRCRATSPGSGSTATAWCSWARAVHQQRIRATMTSRTSVDRGRHRVRQGAHQPAAGRRRAAGAALGDRGRRRTTPCPRRGRIGYPVVVKPLDGNHGRGVCLDLRSEEDVRKAFPIALRESRGGDVVVETYVHGDDHRVLVIGGRMVAIAERVPAGVDGGRHAHGRGSWWTSRTATRGAASATRRCSPASSSTRRPWSSWPSRA